MSLNSSGRCICGVSTQSNCDISSSTQCDFIYSVILAFVSLKYPKHIHIPQTTTSISNSQSSSFLHVCRLFAEGGRRGVQKTQLRRVRGEVMSDDDDGDGVA